MRKYKSSSAFWLAQAGHLLAADIAEDRWLERQAQKRKQAKQLKLKKDKP